MFFVFLYIGLLFISPHDWLQPFVGLRVDLFVYPAWALWLVLTRRGRDLFRLGAQDALFLAMLAWIVLSISFNRYDAGFGSNNTQLVLNYFKWFALFRLTAVTLGSLAHVRRAGFMLLFFALVMAVEGIQHMHSTLGMGWAGQDFAWMDEMAASAGVAGRTRWVSIFDGPGVFCVIYTIAIPFAMQFLAKPYGFAMRLVGFALLAPLVVATFYTGSRGGFLATLGVFGLFFLIKSGVSVARITAIGLLGLGVLVIAPAHLTSTRDSRGSAQYRIEMWAKGIEMVTTYPILGVGKGSFGSYTKKLIAHNSGIEIAGESGLPGLFFWLGIIYIGFRNLLQAYRETVDPYLRAGLTALSLSLAGYLLSALFVTLEYETLYFLLGMTGAVGATLERKPRFGVRDARNVLVIALVFLMVVKLVAMLYF